MGKYKEIDLYGGEVKIFFDEENHSYWTHDQAGIKKDGSPKMKRLTGVTTFCGIVNKPFLLPWAVNTTVEFIRNNLDLLQDTTGEQLLEMARQESDKQRDLAAEIGKAIHKWIEEHIKGNMPDMPEDEKVLEGVNSFLKWIDQEKIEFIWSERIVYSKTHGYVGTADIGIIKDGKKYLLDIKTGNNLYEEVKMQTAAYLRALSEETGEEYAGRYALRISKETEEQYMKRMDEKNKRRKNPFPIPSFKIFEAVHLDDDSSAILRDFEGFISAIKLYRWKNIAAKEMFALKK